NCPSNNPAGPAPMIATLVRNTCSSRYCRLEPCEPRVSSRLAMIIISYNNVCKGDQSPKQHDGGDVDEEGVFGAAAGRQRDARVRAGEEFRLENLALGAGLASAAEGAGGLGCRGREGIGRHHQ